MDGEVYFVGESQNFSDGDSLVYGQSGKVLGPATTESHKGKGVDVLFSGNQHGVECYFGSVRPAPPTHQVARSRRLHVLCSSASQLSRERPRPLEELLGEYVLDGDAYFIGENQTVSTGDTLEYGQRGKVVGPGTRSKRTSGEGVAVRFPGNKGTIGCFFSEVRPSRTSPSAHVRAHTSTSVSLTYT